MSVRTQTQSWTEVTTKDNSTTPQCRVLWSDINPAACIGVVAASVGVGTGLSATAAVILGCDEEAGVPVLSHGLGSALETAV